MTDSRRQRTNENYKLNPDYPKPLGIRKEFSMIDLSTLSKSYPYLSLARQLGIPYADVLLVSDGYEPKLGPITLSTRGVFLRVSQENHRKILHLTAAVANGEIGHGK
jgi:hypothetical protein